MTVNNETFVEMANPHSWFLVADNLHTQAMELRSSVGRSNLARKDYLYNTELSRDATNRSVFLLSGFALENALKAFLVYENPDWISNGTLSRKLRSHSLTKLCEMSGYRSLQGLNRPRRTAKKPRCSIRQVVAELDCPTWGNSIWSPNRSAV